MSRIAYPMPGQRAILAAHVSSESTKRGDPGSLEEALADHHLEEVAEMIEQAQAGKPSSESPVSDSTAGYLRGS